MREREEEERDREEGREREGEREKKEKKEKENLVGFVRVRVNRLVEELTAAGQHRRSNSGVAADQAGEG